MRRDAVMSLLTRINQHIDKVYGFGLYPPDAASHWSNEIENFANQIARKLPYSSLSREHIDRIHKKRSELANLLEYLIEPFRANPRLSNPKIEKIHSRLRRALEKLDEILGKLQKNN